MENLYASDYENKAFGLQLKRITPSKDSIREGQPADKTTSEGGAAKGAENNSVSLEEPSQERQESWYANLSNHEFRRRFGKDSMVKMRYEHARQFQPVFVGDIHIGPDSGSGLVLDQNDYAYRKDTWDGAPIVLEKYKLIFYTVPKVGCTVFKQLFKRMMGHRNWRLENRFTPHHPRYNQLTYLSAFEPDTAKKMLLSSEWTKAIFIRDPKERVLSAYLDKAEGNDDRYVNSHCCPRRGDCHDRVRSSFRHFLELAASCHDPHWNPQAWRMEAKYWPHINFVGHLETAREDTERLLRQVGAWEEFGANGWGKSQTEAIFQSSSLKHQTGAHERLQEHFDSNETEGLVEKLYEDDYQNPVLGLENKRISKQGEA